MANNDSANQGDAGFHYALHQGKILTSMITKKQKQEIYAYLHDGFLDRIEQERGFIYSGSGTPAYAWISRFNSLGYIMPINTIWKSWWKIDSLGKAVSVLMYASGLIYSKDENPIFDKWTPTKGGGGPYLTESDADIYDSAWLKENINFLKETLSVEYIQQKVQLAATLLSEETEAKMATKIANDALKNSDILEIKIEDLIINLSRPNLQDTWDN